MNKMLLSCTLFMCTAFALQAQQTFTIKGKFSELKAPQKVALRYSTGKKIIMDTTMVINGAFSFNGKVQDPVKASLYLIPLRLGKMVVTGQELQDREGIQHFFLEQGKITVSGKENMNDALVRGGKTQGEYLLLLKQLKPLQDQQDEISRKWGQLSRQKLAAAERKFGSELTTDQRKEAISAAHQEMPPGLSLSEFRAKIAKVEHDFIRQRPDSYVSFDLVRRYVKSDMDAISFESLYNSLSQRLRDTEEGRLWPFRFLSYKLNVLDLGELKSAYAKLGSQYKNTSLPIEAKEISNKFLQRINVLEATTIGRPAIPIKKADINGNPVNWESFKGKYLLLDFWASWCAPCRASHPHLKELYAKYKDKGFEILSIANEGGDRLEHIEKSWKAAIDKDGLPWPQILNDIDKEKFDAVKVYGIKGVGTKVLLDKEGKIISHYTGSEAELDQKLKELFGF